MCHIDDVIFKNQISSGYGRLWALYNLVPRPSAHTKRVWCSAHFLSHGEELISGFEIWDHQLHIAEDLNIIAWHKQLYFELIEGSENSHSLFSAVPVDSVVILSYCNWGCVVVHMHQGVTKIRVPDIKMQLWYSLQSIAPPHVTRNVAQNTRPSSTFQGGSGNKISWNVEVRNGMGLNMSNVNYPCFFTSLRQGLNFTQGCNKMVVATSPSDSNY